MEGGVGKKIWMLFQKNIKNLFFGILVILAVSDFFIHRHHHFKIGEIHLFEAAAGMIFIFILAILANLLKVVLFKPENYYNK